MVDRARGSGGCFEQGARSTVDGGVEAEWMGRRVAERREARGPEGAVGGLPATMGRGPEPTLAGPEADEMRARMLAVNSVAGSTGSPTVVVPAIQLDGRPVGLGLLGRPGSDTLLLDAAASLD